MYIYMTHTKQVDSNGNIMTCIQEVLGLDVSWDNDHDIFHGFLQFLDSIVPLPSVSFVIHYSLS
jgi:hypothetical protein